MGTPNEWPYVVAAYLAVFVGHGKPIVAAEDQRGQRAAGEVDGGHPVADVPAGPAQPVGAEPDRRVPAPRDVQRAAPGVREVGFDQRREQLAGRRPQPA